MLRARVRRYVNGIPIFPVNASTSRYLEAQRQSRNCSECASHREKFQLAQFSQRINSARIKEEVALSRVHKQ